MTSPPRAILSPNGVAESIFSQALSARSVSQRSEMPNADALRQVGRMLRDLAESTPESAGELPAWYKRARELESVLRSDSGALSDAIPHCVWHYLADADIRPRDLVYRADQQAAILEIIMALEAGHSSECAG